VETFTRNQGEKKVMCWAGMVYRSFIIHWFEGKPSVEGKSYLKILEQVVKGVATRKKYVFQMDGAMVHTTLAVRAFSEQTF
jgi:hypothetical protein